MLTDCVSFFFQAEDGIRDDLVTGVQTCALPICKPSLKSHDHAHIDHCLTDQIETQPRREQSAKSTFAVISRLHSPMQEDQIKDQHHDPADHAVFLDHNCIYKIRIGMRKYVSLVTVPGSLARNSSRCHGDPGVFCLKGKLGSIDETQDPVLCRFTPYAKLDGNSPGQCTHQYKHGKVFHWHAADEHHEHARGKQQDRR